MTAVAMPPADASEDSEEEAWTRTRMRNKAVALRRTWISLRNIVFLGLLNLCQPAGKQFVAGLG